jgi:hypothetical protein
LKWVSPFSWFLYLIYFMTFHFTNTTGTFTISFLFTSMLELFKKHFTNDKVWLCFPTFLCLTAPINGADWFYWSQRRWKWPWFSLSQIITLDFKFQIPKWKKIAKFENKNIDNNALFNFSEKIVIQKKLKASNFRRFLDSS